MGKTKMNNHRREVAFHLETHPFRFYHLLLYVILKKLQLNEIDINIIFVPSFKFWPKANRSPKVDVYRHIAKSNFSWIYVSMNLYNEVVTVALMYSLFWGEELKSYISQDWRMGTEQLVFSRYFYSDPSADWESRGPQCLIQEPPSVTVITIHFNFFFFLCFDMFDPSPRAAWQSWLVLMKYEARELFPSVCIGRDTAAPS